MYKYFVMDNLPDLNDLPAVERWHWWYHVPEVLRSAPYVARYVCYWAVRPPPGGENYGYYNYKIHENWGPPLDERGGRKGFLATKPQPAPVEAVTVMLPSHPTEDFMGGEHYVDERTILRWVTVFRYPEGVPVEEGEDWYLNVHAKEVMQQPGLTRFFSYRTIPIQEIPPLEGQQQPSFRHPQSKRRTDWHRVSELWYENNNGWRKSIIESPPEYTKPPWAEYDQYPFLEPKVHFVSTFILEKPTFDYLKEVRPFYV